MQSMKSLLTEYGYYTVSYLDFCVDRLNPMSKVNENVKFLREQIKRRCVVFTDWEHERILDPLSSNNFIGFKEVLGDYYNTNKWAMCVPTFGHKNFAPRQIHNLDFLVYVNTFNKKFDASKIDHSNKKHDFLYLNGKAHPFRVNLLSELLRNNLLNNSVWSASSLSHAWNTLDQKLPEKYEWPQWRGKAVDGYDETTRQVYHPAYNDTICSIVPETLSDNDCHYITEKTCKPIMAEHLFVILSGSGFLKNLRSLGFKTFHEHFDESYDDCPHLNDRVRGIIRTLQQIKSMDVKKLYKDTEEIRRHNREHFFDEGFYKDFNYKELLKIKNYFGS